MMDRYKKSQEFLARALKVTPGGSQTLSKRANRFPEGAYPVCLRRGEGAHVIDVDGNRYLDMICGLASMTLGYQYGSPYNIFGSVLSHINSIGGGASFSMATELEVEVAEKICAMIPCAEMVRFVKTGSEATEAAIRVARKATGRDIILTVGEGYHSWHSWFQVLKQSCPGVPIDYRSMVRSVTFNDSASVMAHLQFAGRPVAAVILEPCHYEEPAPGYLPALRELCTKHGALLIFDEMVTGFRWHNGGAQEYYGITPDLACFGKACANGFPLAFLCGKAEYMEHADVVSGTFGGETVGLAACNAVLDIYYKEPIIDTLWERGWQFQSGFNDMAKVMDVPAICDGFPVKPRIRFVLPDDKVHNFIEPMPMSLFLQETARRGILWHPAGGNVSAAMSSEDIEYALGGMAESLIAVREALDSGDWSVLKGKPIQSTPFVRKS